MPRAADTGQVANPFSLPSPLGFRHWDGEPLTLEDCTAEYRKVCKENTARAAEMRALERLAKPDKLAHAALCRLARIGNARAQAWDALEALGRLALEEGGL